MLGIFLDTETNGLNSQKHKIIEIAFQIIDLTTGTCKDSFESVLSISPQDWQKSDPKSLEVNGFNWQMVCQGLPSLLVAQQIQDCFAKNQIARGKAVFICQNPSFDRAFFSYLIDPELQESLLFPYHWLDLASMYWAEAIRKAKVGLGPFPWETGCSKDAIAKAYSLGGEQQPHRAMNGVLHLLLCYKAIVGFPKCIV
ncbi:MAG: 3'-5' exonuclease [Candidatus Rhabdochlamydia sp.]